MATQAPAKHAQASNASAADAAAATVTVNHVVGSKAQMAQEIFDQDARTKPRKEVISRFMKEAELTQAGASTYYQNFKRIAGMVKPRVIVTTNVEQGGEAPRAPATGAVKETTTA